MSSSEASDSDSELEEYAQTSLQRDSRRNAAFEPPQGAVPIGGPEDVAGAIEMGEFDWDSVKDDKDIELWLVRVPNSVCPGSSHPPLLLLPCSCQRLWPSLAYASRALDR